MTLTCCSAYHFRGATRLGWAAGTVLWSEALSCQLEYKYLAHLTGRYQYFDTVRFAFCVYFSVLTPSRSGISWTSCEMPISTRADSLRSGGSTFEQYFLRYVTYWHYSSSLPSSSADQFSVGAFADSAHEYLLKQWLMSSRSEPKARDLCMSQPYKYLSSNTHIFIFLRPSRLGQYHQALTLPFSITEPSLCNRYHSQCSQPHYGTPIVFHHHGNAVPPR